jgi:hypothetical protein
MAKPFHNLCDGSRIEQDDFTLIFFSDRYEIESKGADRHDTLTLPLWAFETMNYEQMLNQVRLFLLVHYGAKAQAVG